MTARETFAQQSAQKILEKFTSARSQEFRAEHTLTVDLQDLRAVLEFCHNELKLNFLIDITSVDNTGEQPRFNIVYELAMVDDFLHLRIKTAIADGEQAPTVSDLWATANWHEREIYDMMGIRFTDHPDLRRILMWEGYPFYPLRKEFPLAGKPSEMPDVGFTKEAPLAGGPFVAKPASGSNTRAKREPRAR